MPPKKENTRVKPTQDKKERHAPQPNREDTQAIQQEPEQLDALQERLSEIGNEEAENILDTAFIAGDDFDLNEFLEDGPEQQEQALSMDEQVEMLREPKGDRVREEEPLPEAPQQEVHPLDQLNLIQRTQVPADGKQFKPVRKEYQTIGFLGKTARVFGHVLFSPLTLVQTLWNSAKRGIRKARRAFVRWKNADMESENARGGERNEEQDAAAPKEGQDAGLPREQGAVPPKSALEKAVKEIREGTEDQEILNRHDRRPMMWEKFIAEDPEMSPYISVDIKQANERSGNEMGEVAHTSLALHYTRYDESTGEKERCKVKFGFWPGAGTNFPGSTLIQMGRGALIPGSIQNDIDMPVTVGKRYGANNRQINQILLEAESYEAGGFNMLKRNCTTFVLELTQNAGFNTQDILQKSTLDLGAAWLLTPILPVAAAIREGLGSDSMKRLTEKDNLGYGRKGQKLASQEEYDRFHEATDNLQTLSSYSPKAAAERIRRGEATLLHSNSYLPTKEDDEGNLVTVKGFGEAMIREKEVLYAKIRAVAGSEVDADISLLDKKIDAAVDSHSDNAKSVDRLKRQLRSAKVLRGEISEQDIHRESNEICRQMIRELQELREYVSGWYYGVVGGDNRLMIPFLHLVSIMEHAEDTVNEHYYWQEGGNENRDVSPHLANLQKSVNVKYKGYTWNEAGESTSNTLADGNNLVIGTYLVSLVRTYGSVKEGLSQTARFFATSPENVKDKAWYKRQRVTIFDYQKNAQKAIREDFFRKGLTEEDVSFAFSTLPKAMDGVSQSGASQSTFNEHNGVNAYQALAYEKVFGGMANRVKELRKDYDLTSDNLYDALAEFILERAQENREYFGMIIRGIKESMPGDPSAADVYNNFIQNFTGVYVYPVVKTAAPEIKSQAEYDSKLFAFIQGLTTSDSAESEKLPGICAALKELIAEFV